MKVGKVYIDLLEAPTKEVFAKGGTRAGKTYALAQIAAIWLMTGTIGSLRLYKGVCDVVRKTLPALKASFLRDFIQACEELQFHPARSYDDFTCEGRLVSFYGLDTSEKVKSRKRDILFCNEITSLDEQDYIDLMVRTKFKIFADYNPDFGSWVRAYEERATTLTYNYLDNPFLSVQETEAVNMLKGNLYLWQTLGLGNYMAPKGLVYPSWEVFTDLPYRVQQFGKVYGGLDLGMNDPTAGVIAYFLENEIYVYQLCYASNMSNETIANFLSTHPDIAFYCDHDLRTLNELRNLGARNVTKAIKGQGSITSGVRIIQGKKLYIHESALDIQKELRSYVYTSNTFVPEDKNNHSMDALRMIVNSMPHFGIKQHQRVMLINRYENINPHYK